MVVVVVVVVLLWSLLLLLLLLLLWLLLLLLWLLLLLLLLWLLLLLLLWLLLLLLRLLLVSMQRAGAAGARVSQPGRRAQASRGMPCVDVDVRPPAGREWPWGLALWRRGCIHPADLDRHRRSDAAAACRPATPV